MNEQAEHTPAVIKFETEQWASIGQQLRQARERKQWSAHDVAKRLCLSTEIIHDLEDDNFLHGPGLMFMRGYLKIYARLLELPLDCIMQQFNALNLCERKTRLAAEQIIYKTQRPYFYRLKNWGVFVVAIILITAVILWWRSGDQIKTPVPSKTPVVATTSSPSTASIKTTPVKKVIVAKPQPTNKTTAKPAKTNQDTMNLF